MWSYTGRTGSIQWIVVIWAISYKQFVLTSIFWFDLIWFILCAFPIVWVLWGLHCTVAYCHTHAKIIKYILWGYYVNCVVVNALLQIGVILARFTVSGRGGLIKPGPLYIYICHKGPFPRSKHGKSSWRSARHRKHAICTIIHAGLTSPGQVNESHPGHWPRRGWIWWRSSVRKVNSTWKTV